MDGDVAHEFAESLVEGIMDAACARLGVSSTSPLFTTLEPIAAIVIEETARALLEEGICSFDWHRNTFDGHVGDVCRFCELPVAEHERMPVCPQQQPEETEPEE
jgi:hypothetical protein